MKEQIISILNENSAELTVEKAMKIAALLCEREFGRGEPELKLIRELHFYYHVTQSFESFKKIRLEKGQFVCEVEEPEFFDESVDYQTQKHSYELALKKVIFAGFKSLSPNTVDLYQLQITLKAYGKLSFIEIGFKTTQFDDTATIGDLLTEISRYNQTAKEPINLKFTENILPLLGVKNLKP